MAIRLLGRRGCVQPRFLHQYLGGARSVPPAGATLPSLSDEGGSGGVFSSLLPVLRRHMSTRPGDGRDYHVLSRTALKDLFYGNRTPLPRDASVVYVHKPSWVLKGAAAGSVVLFGWLLLLSYKLVDAREEREKSDGVKAALRSRISALEKELKERNNQIN